MNINTNNQAWKFALFIAAIIVGFGSLWYTNKLVSNLSTEERKKIQLWAEAQKQIADIENMNNDMSFLTEILQNNKNIPVILANDNDSILSWLNLDSAKVGDATYLKDQLQTMKSQHTPIVIHITDEIKNYIYYKDSFLLTQLFYYPFFQLAVIFLFIFVSYLVFSTSRKAEQNQVWVGMSKETAHQLGTPISSLIAWLELLKLKEEDTELVAEVEKDIKRLEKITERFSKIGSTPVLDRENIIPVLKNSINYLKSRTSQKVSYNLHFASDDEIIVPLNVSLFEWVVENLCKNAVDAMNGSGTIDINITDFVQVVYIDIKDSGKGIPKSKYKTVFMPGYTTKKRGWGLGLSLTKRIVESYHSGKIFVKSSEINNGTTFRIALKKS